MRTFLLAVLAGFALPAFSQSSTPPQNPPADTIYFGGNILTGTGLDGAAPDRVSALAIRGGLIAVTGSNATVLTFKGPRTQVIDLHGDFVMPGIIDAHTHMAEAGRLKLSVDLTGTKSLAEMKARIAAAARTAHKGQWLQGGGWDHTLWNRKVLPTRADLDGVTAGHPAIFTRVDGHISIANTAALKAAGITRATHAPKGGKIDHDSRGNLTGIVRETAVRMVYGKIPLPTHAQRKRALELALADAAAHGVTSVQDYSDWADFLVLEEMERAGHLPVRVSEWLTFGDPVSVLEQHRAGHAADDRMLHTGMLKGFMDGSLGSRTAALNAPYADDPGNSGIPRYDAKTLNRMTAERMRGDFQIGFHAIGDRAVGMALDAFAEGEPQRPQQAERPQQTEGAAPAQHPASRPRIEHSQVVDAPDFDRYRELGVIASMQPNHLLTDMAWATERLGSARARYSYAWKSFLEHGVPLCFGTDYPVEPITPFRGIYAAVTRKNEAGTQTYFPEERLSMGQALYAYTQGSAYAEFAEGYKGRLTPGYVADFVILDRDITRIPPAEILGARVLRTVMDGHPVFESGVQARSR